MTIFRYTLPALLVVAMLATHASAANLVAGYNVGANDPGQLGSSFIIDQAALGGGDARNDDGFYGWVAQYTDMWDVGTSVSITGMALPVKAGNTGNGDWTFTFFELDSGSNPNSFDGYNFQTGTGESIIAQTTATFSGKGSTGTDEYYVNFDAPINFTSASTGMAFHLQSTAGLELKIRPAGLAASRGVRVGLGDGAPVGGANPNLRASIAGTPVAFDPPDPPAFTHRFEADQDTPGDNVWLPLENSVERFRFNPKGGDYNNDGFTDAADYTRWRDNLGADSAEFFSLGTRDPNSVSTTVDQGDYDYWRDNYGLAPGSVVDVNDPAVPGITKAFNEGMIGNANFDDALDGTQASRQDASFEIWFKPDDLTGGDQIIYEVGGSGRGIYFSLEDDVLSFFAKSQFSGNDQTVSTTLASAGWTQVVGVIHNTFSASAASSDDYLELYINGALVDSNELATTDLNDWAGGNQAGLGQDGQTIAVGGPITIAGDTTESGQIGFNGQIAIMEYDNAAWDAAEVLARYNAITSVGVAATAVPEPSTALLMLAVSLAGMGAYTRQR